MTRRGFLSLMGVAAAAAALPFPKVLIAHPEVVRATTPIAGLPLVGLEQMTREVAAAMLEALPPRFHQRREFARGAYPRLGDPLVIGEGQFRHHNHVGLDWNNGDDDGLSVSQDTVRLIGEALAKRVVREDWQEFGALDLPAAVPRACRVSTRGVSVRAIADFRVAHEFESNARGLWVPVVRFDVLGG